LIEECRRHPSDGDGRRLDGGSSIGEDFPTVDDEPELVRCTHCHREFPRTELRNGVCPECIANDY
jgi:Zn finger protein HypA/HybF involved in hydrogenase expression